MAVGPKLILQVFEHHRRNFKRAELSALFEEPSAWPGLFAAKRIVDLHRGQLWTKTEFGKGTTFYVSWPPWTQPGPLRD
jgi:signal transduction histidine kinase